MKKIIYYFLSILLTGTSFGAELLDVKVLETASSKDGIEVKLQVKNPPKGAFFYIDITRDDPKAFEKMILITKKLEKGASFKLNLNIPSFSLLPSGSYYRSLSVKMSSTTK